MEESDDKDFSVALMDGQVIKGEKRPHTEKDKKDEEEKKKPSSSGKDGGASSGKEHARAGKSKKKNKSQSYFPPVSHVFQACKTIGLLGEGVTGPVIECDYDGQLVAVKIGLKDSLSDICMRLLENDIVIYKVSKDLQGVVILHMIVRGLDPVYSAGIALITRKCGWK